MADSDLYPPLVDPQFADFAEKAYANIAARMRRPVPEQPPQAPPPENALLTDIGRGLARGVMVTAPETFGQALQAFGADETGKAITEAARERGKDEGYRTTGLAGEVASMLPTALGVGALAAIPGLGPTAGTALAAGAGGALFGGSQYTATREKGGTVEQALGTGAIQGVGQAIGGAVAGRLVSGAASAIRGRALERGFEQFTNPSLWGTVGRGLVHAEAVQLPTQAAAMGGVAAVEKGLPDTPTAWEAAKESFAPTALLTAALAPFGAFGIAKTNRQRLAIAGEIRNTELPVDQRLEAVRKMATELKQADPEGAADWQLEASRAILAGDVPELRPGYKYEPKPQEELPALRAPYPQLRGPLEPVPPPDVTGMEARNEEMWAARNAEEERMRASRDPFSVTEMGPLEEINYPLREVDRLSELEQVKGPTEEITIGDVAPEPPKPAETIRVRAPEEVPTYDVTDLATHIEIKTPDAYNDTNRQGRATWLRDILGPNTNAAVGKLVGLRAESLPAAVREMWHEKGGEGAKAAYVKKLEDLYHRITGRNIRDPLFDNPFEELRRAQEEGENLRYNSPLTGDAKIEALKANAARMEVARVEVEREQARMRQEKQDAAKAAKKDDTRTEPESAAVAARPEVASAVDEAARAGRDAEPGVRDSEVAAREALTQEKANAPVTRQEPEGRVEERQGDGGQRVAEGVNREREGEIPSAREAGGGRGSDVEGRAEPRNADAEAAITQAQDAEAQARAAYEAVTPELQQAKQRLAVLDAGVAELKQLQGQRAALARLGLNRKLTQEQSNALAEMNQRIRDLRDEQRKIVESGEREALLETIDAARDVASETPEAKALDKAVGRSERAQQRGEGEQAADPAYYSFTKGKLDPNTGKGVGANRQKVFSYLEATKYAGALPALMKQIPKELRAIFKSMTEPFDAMLGPRYIKVRGAAKDALAGLGEAGSAAHRQFVDYATHIAKSIQTAARVAGPAKAEEAKYAKALGEWLKLHAQFDYQNERVAELLRTGAMTPEEARSLMAQIERGREGAKREFTERMSPDDMATEAFNAIYDKFERDIRYADEHKQGLAALDNQPLAAAIGQTPHAMGALDHIARTNQNPFVKEVAKLLMKSKLKTTIRVVENPDFNGGRYVPSKDVIEIGRGGMNATTLLHETTHAVAHAAIIRGLANVDRTQLSARERKEVAAVKEIQRVMKRFSEIADGGNPEHMYALKDVHEFLSEAMNNPDIQVLLGATGKPVSLWKQFTNYLKDLVGWPREKTDFEALMSAAPALFGNPNRSLDVVFRNPLNYALRGDAFTAGVSALRQLTGFDWLNRKVEQAGRSGVGGAIHEAFISTSSLNHQKYMVGNILNAAARQFPQYKATFDKLRTIHDEFRGHISDRSSVRNLGQTEANDIATRAFQLRGKDRASFDRAGKMGTEVTRLQIDASAKSYAEAKARNPSITPEQWNSPDAQRLRAEYKALEVQSERMRKQGAKVTPISIYHEMVDHNDLLLTRGAAERMAVVLRTFGADRVPEIAAIMDQIDSRIQAGNGPGDVPAKLQREVLDRGMKQVLAETKKIYDREVAAGGKKGKGALDAETMQTILSESYGLHERLRRVPYMHIGRAGNKMVMFTVKGGDAEWNTISKLLNGTREQGGLERGMGPPHEGDRRIYMKFDNDSHYMDAVEKLKPHLDAGILEKWADGAVDEKLRSLDAATPQFMRTLRDRINSNDKFDQQTKEALTSELFDAFLQQLPDNSPLKSSATRDGLNGYSTDYIQSFQDRATMATQSLSRVRSSSRIANTMTEFGAALKELRETPGLTDVKTSLGRYVQDFRHRVDELNTPVHSPYIDRIRAFPAAWRLAMTPAYVATIAYQPWQVTLPILGARFGYAKTLSTMTGNAALSVAILNKALKMGWLKSEGTDTWTRAASLANLKLEFAKMTKKDGSPLFTEQQLDLLNHVQWSNVLNFGQTNQIARVNPEERFAGSKAFSIGTIAPHYVEVSNRLISALSAHQLMMDQAKAMGLTGKALADAHAKAKDYAVQVIRDSDGDHSQANIARNLGRRGVLGKYTPLAVGFQNYFIQTTEMMMRQLILMRSGSAAERKEAAKVFAGVSGMTGAMAGVLGMPFMGLATALANRIGSLFQDPNDDPPDLQLAVRQTLHKAILGVGVKGEAAKSAEEALSRGLPRLADVDMSSRVGLHDVMPFTPFLEDRRKLEDSIKDHAFNMLGPAVGAFAGIATGAHAATQGDWPKFINDALPSAVRGWAKAYRQANYGYETEGANNRIPIAAPTAWNLLAQAGGFTAGKKAEQGERAFTYKTNQQLLERRQQELRNRMYRAFDSGDYAEFQRLMQDEVQFIMRHPWFHPNIGQGLQQRAQARAVGEVTGTGILAGKRAVYPIMQQYPQFQ